MDIAPVQQILVITIFSLFSLSVVAYRSCSRRGLNPFRPSFFPENFFSNRLSLPPVKRFIFHKRKKQEEDFCFVSALRCHSSVISFDNRSSFCVTESLQRDVGCRPPSPLLLSLVRGRFRLGICRSKDNKSASQPLTGCTLLSIGRQIAKEFEAIRSVRLPASAEPLLPFLEALATLRHCHRFLKTNLPCV